MRVLFICSGNSKNRIGVVVKNQAASLMKNGVKIDFFTIVGKGKLGYLKNSLLLSKYIKKNKYDIYHAHFSFSAFSASLAGCKPLVVSLMGSDTFRTGILKVLIRVFNLFFWKEVIVKSDEMKHTLKLKNCTVIPNGVDLDKFNTNNKNSNQRNIPRVIFVADPNRKEKNYQLAETAIDLLQQEIEFKIFSNVSNEIMPKIMNDADVLLLTSLYEGSPNIIKEAMACNLPIVSTNVGDVLKNIGNIEGCYITSFEPHDVADKIKKAIHFGKKTTGRKKLMELGLDSNTISNKIISVYKKNISS